MTSEDALNPQIDILMATYQGEKYVSQQIDSILHQSYPSIRLIIRDDGSTDGTPLILEEYAKRYPEKIALLPTDKNLGIRGNFSKIMENATSLYIMFSDQDDIWDADKVAVTYAKMRDLENDWGKEVPLLVHTDLRVVSGDLHLINPSFWKYAKLNPARGTTLNRLLVQNMITGCTVMINRPCLKKASPIPQTCIMHDWWLGLVAGAFGALGHVEKSTLAYRQHTNNALGAQQYSLRRGFKKTLMNLPEWRQKSRDQAHEFKERYLADLLENQKEALCAYIKLCDSTPWGEVFLTFKYGFFRHGIVRNMGVLSFKMLDGFRSFFSFFCRIRGRRGTPEYFR